MSEICQLQKTVRKLSEMCQICVRNLSDSKLCQKCVKTDLENYKKSVWCQKCVWKLSYFATKNCLKSVISEPTDRFLTHIFSDPETFSWNICHKNVSENCQISTSDIFLTHFKETFAINNVSENCQLLTSDTFLIHLRSCWETLSDGKQVKTVSEICREGWEKAVTSLKVRLS